MTNLAEKTKEELEAFAAELASNLDYQHIAYNWVARIVTTQQQLKAVNQELARRVKTPGKSNPGKTKRAKIVG